jgi:hypothetical protein
MERWYLPINCHSRGRVDNYTKKIIEQISGYIHRQQLYNMVPVIFIEEKPQRDFFLFIAIESEQKPKIPDILSPLIKHVGNPLPGVSVDYDEIKPMVSNRPVTPHDYARRLKYREALVSPKDDPFDFLEEAPSPQDVSSDEQVMPKNYDKLLYWLSAAGTGTWQTFKNACKVLGLDASGLEARRILRRLRLLGHIEVSRDGTHWAICPPCLVSIKTEPQQECILAGQRCAQLLNEIEKIEGVNLKFIKQPNEEAPTLVYVQIDSEDILYKLVDEVEHYFPINYAGNAIYKLAEILPSLEVWRDSLTPVGRFFPALYEIERFSNGTFALCSFQGETGMYRLHPRDRNSQVSRTLFYQQDSDQWLQGDWYGLRFLALRAENTECKAIYHTDIRCLALPASQRWPDLYERALVLCSGKLADQRNEWLYFSEVPREIAHKLAHKLTATYEEIY